MPQDVELSFVIPVFNGARTIGGVVRRIHELYSDLRIDVVLVDDGSYDDSERVCRELQEEFPLSVTFVHLARNFGEHNAVLAGMNRARGAYLALLDDDGQNPPEEVRKLYDGIRANDWDVVYGRYQVKQHSRWRNMGSRFNDRVANWTLGKPHDLYLSSFKLLNRFAADEVVRYHGPFPYLDGLILRATRNVGQVDVEHLPATTTRSNYTLSKLAWLWMNMFLNFTIAPLRAAALLGVVASALSLLLIGVIIVDKLFINPTLTRGVPTILATVVFFSGVQLVILGVIGEYLGRLFLDYSRSPQFVVRYVTGPGKDRVSGNPSRPAPDESARIALHGVDSRR